MHYAALERDFNGNLVADIVEYDSAKKNVVFTDSIIDEAIRSQEFNVAGFNLAIQEARTGFLPDRAFRQPDQL